MVLKGNRPPRGRFQNQLFVTPSTATLDPQLNPGDSNYLFTTFLTLLQSDRSFQSNALPFLDLIRLAV